MNAPMLQLALCVLVARGNGGGG